MKQIRSDLINIKNMPSKANRIFSPWSLLLGHTVYSVHIVFVLGNLSGQNLHKSMHDVPRTDASDRYPPGGRLPISLVKSGKLSLK